MKREKYKLMTFFVLLAVLAPVFVFATNAPTSPSPFTPIGEKSFIRVPNFFRGEAGPAAKTTVGGVITDILNVVLLVVGGLSVLFLMYGGLRYLTAAGNEDATESAKSIIKHAILGLVIVILSFAIIAIITRVLITGRP